MTVPYIDKVNQRVIGSEQQIFSESHQIGTTSLNTATPDTIRLIEVPLQQTPSSVVIPGFTEVTTTPGTNEFKVDYTNGRITFHPSRNGQFVTVDYKGRGSIVDAEDINELQQIFVGSVSAGNPTTGIASLDGTLSEGIVRPINISTVPTDDFVFLRDVQVGRDLTVIGNLDVQGTLTTIQTETVTIDDNKLLLNSNVTGAATEDAGFEIERGTDPNVELIWNETNDSWQLKGTAGTALLEVFDTGVISSPGILSLADGSAAAPSLTFTSDTDSGLFLQGPDNLGWAVNGIQHLALTTGQLSPGSTDGTMSIGSASARWNDGYIRRVLLDDGAVGSPSLTFQNDTDSGIYSIGADNFGLAVNGSLKLEIADTLVSSRVVHGFEDGTAAAPSISFNNALDLGIYVKALGASQDQIGFTSEGAFVMGVGHYSGGGSGFFTVDGTAALPAWTFNGDTDTGLYRIAGDTLGITANGAEQVRVDSTGTLTVQSTVLSNIFKGRTSNIVIQPQSDSTSAIVLQNAAGGTSVLTIDTTNTRVGIGSSVTPDATLHNAGSTVLGLTTDTDPGSIAVATVDGFTGIVITTSAAISVTLPTPTVTTLGRFFTVLHQSSSTGTLSVDGSNVGVGKGSTFMWDGSSWIPVGATGGFELLASDPATPVKADVWFNDTDKQFKGYNGTEIVILG